jgi:hypothetical protein
MWSFVARAYLPIIGADGDGVNPLRLMKTNYFRGASSHCERGPDQRDKEDVAVKLYPNSNQIGLLFFSTF